jgi:apolipoprotein N-acyltransferase
VVAALFARLAGLSGWRARMAALLLGVLSAAALPPIHAIPVLLLAVPRLLTLIDAQRDWRGAAWIGFWFGFGLHLIGLYWITEAILIEAARFWWLVPFAVPGLAAVLAVFIAVPCALARLAPAGWRRVPIFAGTWLLADLLRQFVATGFPWNPLGSVWEAPGGFGNVFIQPAAWIGVHGLTLLTLLLAASPSLGRRAMAGGIAVLALWAGVGLWRLSQPASPPPGLTAVLVQENVAEGTIRDAASAEAAFSRELSLTQQGVARANGARTVVVWSETASPYLLATDSNARAAIADVSAGPALVGSVRFDEQGRPRNSLMALVNAGPPVVVYDKWHLVPFGEYAPSWIPISIPTLPGGGMASGTGPKTLHVPGLPPAGALICYEAIFPAQVVDRADRPEWLVNVTNDAWFGNSTGPRQHLAAARMRAVEEGLPLIRAANTGISAGFDAFGRELGRLEMNRIGVLDIAIPGYLPATPFARFGLAIPLALALLTIGAGVIPAVNRR